MRTFIGFLPFFIAYNFFSSLGVVSFNINVFLDIVAALIRHNKPGIAAFRLANGYAALRDALSSENVRFQRYSTSSCSLVHIYGKIALIWTRLVVSFLSCALCIF